MKLLVCGRVVRRTGDVCALSKVFVVFCFVICLECKICKLCVYLCL